MRTVFYQEHMDGKEVYVAFSLLIYLFIAGGLRLMEAISLRSSSPQM